MRHEALCLGKGPHRLLRQHFGGRAAATEPALDGSSRTNDIVEEDISDRRCSNSMHVSKWGNSLAVRLPKALVESIGLEAGDDLEIVEASKGQMAVRKTDRRAEALARMAARAWSLPAGYRFDRQEANER